ncbi:MAG: hypothetical protein QW666_00235 [Candidatus Woesearchaeota archaeon]
MKKLIFALVAVLVLCASAVIAADYYGLTRYGTYYEYPAYGYGYKPATETSYAYTPTDYYPERYYYQPAPYEYTRYLYRYGMQSPTVIEQPSYLTFYSRVASNAQAGQLCGLLQNKFYDCAPGLYCSIKEKHIGICEKPLA